MCEPWKHGWALLESFENKFIHSFKEKHIRKWITNSTLRGGGRYFAKATHSLPCGNRTLGESACPWAPFGVVC